MNKLWDWLSSNNWLLKRLVVPMTALAVISLFVAWRYSGLLSDVALNFTFLFLGALITVLYVDWSVAAHEAAKWTPFQGSADNHIRRVSTEFAYWVADSFYTSGPGPFMVPAWKMKTETGLWHLDLVRNDDWIAHMRDVATGPAKHIKFETLKGDHQRLIDQLSAYRDQMERALILYGRILMPVQQATAAQLIEEIPPELWLLNATRLEGANFAPASLESILLHALALIRDVNSRSDPKTIELPWKDVSVTTMTNSTTVTASPKA